MSFAGRDAWTLARLIEAGDKGVTPLERPAPRWSEYVRRLRRAGLTIETITEKHGGPYSGHHGRYVLRSAITVLRSKVAA
ncbi:MAG: winged helix domain-containing protein [Bosea sp. (in: a-proteobacteria)]